MRAAEAWAECVTACGGAYVTAWVSGEELQRRYAEPHRRYHDLAHVEHVVATASELSEALGLPEQDAAIVRLAALAHDVVYEGQPGADERASAVWATQHLSAAGVTGRVVDETGRLVADTAEHRAGPDDLLAAALFDADLSILGADAAGYDAYAAKVRQEYAFVSDADWRAGRTAVLQDLLDRDALFVTAPARAWWDEAARANLRREIAGLR
jgi:predicted metal-dependent HD superfamily phosphohydrolase